MVYILSMLEQYGLSFKNIDAISGLYEENSGELKHSADSMIGYAYSGLSMVSTVLFGKPNEAKAEGFGATGKPRHIMDKISHDIKEYLLKEQAKEGIAYLERMYSKYPFLKDQHEHIALKYYTFILYSKLNDPRAKELLDDLNRPVELGASNLVLKANLFYIYSSMQADDFKAAKKYIEIINKHYPKIAQKLLAEIDAQEGIQDNQESKNHDSLMQSSKPSSDKTDQKDYKQKKAGDLTVIPKGPNASKDQIKHVAKKDLNEATLKRILLMIKKVTIAKMRLRVLLFQNNCLMIQYHIISFLSTGKMH